MGIARYLIFEIQQELYAAAVGNVAEIMDPPALYPLPKVPRYYRGVMNCHGRPVPVVDLSLICKEVPSAGPGKLIVLNGKEANLALLVDNVATLITGDFPSEEPTGDESGVEKVITTTDGAIKVIGSKKLLKLLEEEING
jgi:chemotaxis signal transduction protein